MKFFKRNMKLLKKKSKAFYNSINNYQQSEKVIIEDEIDEEEIVAQVRDLENDLVINVEEARKEGYTIKVIKNNKETYLHSKYDPFKEVDKIVDNLELNYQGQDQIFALGFGLGYHLTELFSRDRFDRVFIIEPYLSIFYAAMLYNDLSPILKSEKVALIIGSKDNIYPIIRKDYQVSLAKKIKFFEHSPSLNLFEEDYSKVYEEIKNAVEYKNISKMTDIKVAKQWRNNIISNLSYILESPKADDFFGLFSNQPIICVAAGPSLDKNIDQLKQAKDKALIICVGTALKALLKAGIEPDIIISMDGSKKVYQQFKDISLLNDVFLFSEKANSPLVNQGWVGPQVFFTMKRNLSGWVEKMKGEYTVINTGGSVAHSMVDLAYKFGGNPIILVGQDLAYADKKTHASGTMYAGNKVGEKELISVEGIDGKPVETSKGFKSFLNHFNNYFAKRPDRLYIDATEGGAKIKYTEIMSLQKAINNYCTELFYPLNILYGVYTEKKERLELNFDEFEDEVEETIQELEDAIEILKCKLSMIKGIERKISRIKEISNKKMAEVEAEMKSYENKLKKYKRISYFVQRTLIIEELKYQELENRFFLNNKQELEEKIKYYRTYWVNYWKQLEISLKLLRENQIIDEEDKELKDENIEINLAGGGEYESTFK